MRLSFIWISLLLAGMVPSLQAQSDSTRVDRSRDIPYSELARAVASPDPSTRATGLIAMGERFPDSARAFAVTHWKGISLQERLIAVKWIARKDGRGSAELARLLEGVPDDQLEQFRATFGLGADFDPPGIDSLSHAFFASRRVKLRVMGVKVIESNIDPTPVSPAQRAFLMRAAHDPVPELRAAGLSAIGWRIPRSDSSSMAWGTTLIAAGLHDHDSNVREEALHGIAWRGLKVPSEIEAMRRMGRFGSPPETRRTAMAAIGTQGMGALQAVPDLVGYLQDVDDDVAEFALLAITELAGEGVPFPSTIRRDLQRYRTRTSNPYDQLGVIRAFAALRDTVALVERSRDQDSIVAAGAVRALTQVAPMHPAIIEALDDARPAVAGAAILAMVPIILADSKAAHPRTVSGVQALDSARVLARALSASRLVGKCFSVLRGKFLPEMELGLDSVYGDPPREIAFLATPSGSALIDEYRGTIALANGAASTVHGAGLWRWDQSADSLHVDWTTGFSGVTMAAAWSGATLRGTLWTFWDFPRAGQEADVVLTPVECRSIKRDRSPFE